MKLIFRDDNLKKRNTLKLDSVRLGRYSEDFDEENDVFLLDDKGRTVLHAEVAMPEDKAWAMINRIHLYGESDENGVQMNMKEEDRIPTLRSFFEMLFNQLEVSHLNAAVYIDLFSNISEVELQKLGFFGIYWGDRFILLNPKFPDLIGYYTNDKKTIDGCMSLFNRLETFEKRYVAKQKERLNVVENSLQEEPEGVLHDAWIEEQEFLRAVLANFPDNSSMDIDY